MQDLLLILCSLHVCLLELGEELEGLYSLEGDSGFLEVEGIDKLTVLLIHFFIQSLIQVSIHPFLDGLEHLLLYLRDFDDELLILLGSFVDQLDNFCQFYGLTW